MRRCLQKFFFRSSVAYTKPPPPRNLPQPSRSPPAAKPPPPGPNPTVAVRHPAARPPRPREPRTPGRQVTQEARIPPPTSAPCAPDPLRLPRAPRPLAGHTGKDPLPAVLELRRPGRLGQFFQEFHDEVPRIRPREQRRHGSDYGRIGAEGFDLQAEVPQESNRLGKKRKIPRRQAHHLREKKPLGR